MWVVSFIFFIIAPVSFGSAIAALFWGRPDWSIAFGVISIATISLWKFLIDDVGGLKKSE